jgi:hypothetical protein
MSTKAKLMTEWKSVLDKHHLKLEDAKDPLDFIVDKTAQKGSKAGEPGFCTFARALKLLGAVEVMFGNQVANVIMRNKKNKLRALRYVLPKTIQAMILAKDTGGEVEAGIYSLMPPTKARTLVAADKNRRAAAERYRNLPKAERKAIIKQQKARKEQRVQRDAEVIQQYAARTTRKAAALKAAATKAKAKAGGIKAGGARKASVTGKAGGRVKPVAISSIKRVTLQLRDFSGNNGYQAA